jgi:hypothetical protein
MSSPGFQKYKRCWQEIAEEASDELTLALDERETKIAVSIDET